MVAARVAAGRGRKEENLQQEKGGRLVFWLTLDPIFSSLRPSIPTLFIGSGRGQSCLRWENIVALDSIRGIQAVGPKSAPRTVKFGHPRLQTARGCHFGPINGAVSKLFDPTRPLYEINMFQGNMLVHALSDLGATRAGKCAWKAATRAAFRGRK